MTVSIETYINYQDFGKTIIGYRQKIGFNHTMKIIVGIESVCVGCFLLINMDLK